MVSDITKEEVQMSNDHHMVHRGKIFFTNDVQTSGSPVVYCIKTGSSPAHFRGNLSAGAKVSYQLAEGGTVSANGTELTLQGFNRVSTNTLLTKIYRGPTVTGAGTVFRSGQVGFGTNPGQAVTGTGGESLEYVLKPNTTYIFTHTPSISTDMIFGTIMYELDLS